MNNEDIKRKHPILDLQSPSQYHSIYLPRTPYPMPNKRSLPSRGQEDSSKDREAKKSKIAGNGDTLSIPAHLANFPSHDSGYPLYNQYGQFLAVELMKVWESILNQIDWPKVKQDSGVRESSDTYRYFFETIVHPYVEQLLKQEEYKREMTVEFGDRDYEDTSAESESNSSEGGVEDGSQHFEDNISLDSNDSGIGSGDYIDDGTEDETEDDENSEGEDQMDDDFEEIDD